MNKKFYFGLALTAGLFASCSSDDVAVDESRAALNDGDRAAIELLIGSPNSTTRGTGTVGSLGTDAANNKWGGQTFNVYMLNKGTLTVAKDAENNEIYNNTEFTAPNELAGVPDNTPAMHVTTNADGGLTIDTKVSYFPQEGNFDFWAYRLDRAQGTNVPAVENDSMTVQFTIDGSQDIMVAKAVPNVAKNDDGTYGGEKVKEERIFSAYSVRREVKPMLNFQHQLARLTFKVKGDKDLCVKSVDPATSLSDTVATNDLAVLVTGIEVKSLASGKLNVAYTTDPTNIINWTPNSEAKLPLKQRGVDYTPAVLAYRSCSGVSYGTITVGTNAAFVFNESTIVYPDNTSVDPKKGLPVGGFAASLAGTGTYPTLASCYLCNVETAPQPGDISVNADLEALDPVAPIWKTSGSVEGEAYPTPVGEALLVAPQLNYELTVKTIQKVAKTKHTVYCTIEQAFGAGSPSTHADPVVAYTIPAGCQTAADAAGVATALASAAAGDYDFFTEDDKAYKTYTWSGTAVTATSAALYTEPGTVTAATDDADVIAKADAETTAGTKTYKVGTTKYVTVNVTAGATAADATACTYYFNNPADVATAVAAYAGWDKAVDGTGYAAWLAAIAKGTATPGGAITTVTDYTWKPDTKTILLNGPSTTTGSTTTYKPYKANKSYTITLTLAGMASITGGNDNIKIEGYGTDDEGSEFNIDMDEEPSVNP